MYVVKAVMAYDGSNYGGWQKQTNATGIQEIVEKALETIHHEKTEVTASGRTDAKVHAYGQVIHFHGRDGIDPQQYQRALNGILPLDIRILSCEKMPDDFHARFSAKGKQYRYVCSYDESDPFIYKYKNVLKGHVDIEAMRTASQYLLGTHDYTSFSSHKIDPRKPRVKTISRITIDEKENDLVFEFTGTGFLRYQIRMMTGALLAVGRGRIAPSAIKEMLEARDKHACPYNAAPQGLYLMEVYYGH